MENNSIKSILTIVFISVAIELILVVFFLIPVKLERNKSEKNNYDYNDNSSDNFSTDEKTNEEKQLEEEREFEEKKRKEEEQKAKEEEEKEREEEEKYQKEIKKQEEQIKRLNDNIVDKLINIGFKPFKDENYCTMEGEECYSNGTYIAEYNESIKRVTFIKIGDKFDFKTYNCKDDLEFLGKLYNKPSLSRIADKANTIINKYNDDITINIDNMFIQTFFIGEPEYVVSAGIFSNANELNISYVSSIVDSKNEERVNSIKSFYDLSMFENKKYYKYNDYLSKHFNIREMSNVCGMKIIGKNHYNLDSSFCHGGTSDTEFEYSYSRTSPEEDNILIDIKGDYFKEVYMDIIESDLDYFEEKLNYKFEISDTSKKEIDDFIKNQKDKIAIIVNDKMTIIIEYKKNYYFKNYYLTYQVK